MTTTAAETPFRRDPAERAERPSIGSLFADLWRQTTTLAREEAQLAKAELSEKATQAAAGATMAATGGAIVFAGFLALLVAAVQGLILILPVEYGIWLAPLIVGVVVMIVGFALLASGRNELKARILAPSRSAQSLRRDGQMVKEHLS